MKGVRVGLVEEVGGGCGGLLVCMAGHPVNLGFTATWPQEHRQIAPNPSISVYLCPSPLPPSYVYSIILPL